MFKTCIKCGKSLPLTIEYFKNRKDSKDGFRNECKECSAKAFKQYKENHKEHLANYQREWSKANKEKRSEYMATYGPKHYQKNKIEIDKKHVIYNRSYIKTLHGQMLDIAKKNKRKALKGQNGGSYTVDQWLICLEFFSNRCAYSGEIITKNNLNTDHIIPLHSGGSSYINNMCPSVDLINFSKNNNDMETWYRKQKYFSEERLNKIFEWMESDQHEI